MTSETHGVRKTAIVGGTGFIGSHLLSRYRNSKSFTRVNIKELRDWEPDLTIVAAAPGVKWKANQNPSEDLDNIQNLINNLKALSNRKYVLISTIDVFEPGMEFDENEQLPRTHPEAYGRNRGYLEEALQDCISDLHIIRLPGMFGPGLRKNLIFDLTKGRRTAAFHPNSSFQFIDVRRIPETIELTISQGIRKLNLATEPITVAEIFKDIFDLKPPVDTVPMFAYKMISCWVEQISGMQGKYHVKKDLNIATIKSWAEGHG